MSSISYLLFKEIEDQTNLFIALNFLGFKNMWITICKLRKCNEKLWKIKMKIQLVKLNENSWKNKNPKNQIVTHNISKVAQEICMATHGMK